MKNTNYSAIIKRLIREAVGARSNCPIKIVNGEGAPKLVGQSYYYTNASAM